MVMVSARSDHRFGCGRDISGGVLDAILFALRRRNGANASQSIAGVLRSTYGHDRLASPAPVWARWHGSRCNAPGWLGLKSAERTKSARNAQEAMDQSGLRLVTGTIVTIGARNG